MATTTEIHGWPIAEPGDTPDIEVAIGSLADAIDSDAIPLFDTTADRDAVFTAPSAGDACVVDGVFQLYNGSFWFYTQLAVITKKTPVVSANATSLTEISVTLEQGASYIFRGAFFHISGSATADVTCSWETPGYELGLWTKAFGTPTGHYGYDLEAGSIAFGDDTANAIHSTKVYGFIRNVTDDGAMTLIVEADSIYEGVPDLATNLLPGSHIEFIRVA